CQTARMRIRICKNEQNFESCFGSDPIKQCKIKRNNKRCPFDQPNCSIGTRRLFFTALAQKSFALLYTKQTKLKKALCRRNFAGREPFLIREI
ncbi:MAG: hypothetical protein RSD27_01625, partial [Ruthenibacterium sp.]